MRRLRFWFALVAVAGFLLGAPLAGHASAQSFADVRPGDRYYSAVEALATSGVVTGYPDGTFHPYATVTRAQFALMTATMLQLPADGIAPFTDVSSTDWFGPAVAALYQAGIVQGSASDLFAPGADIARQQAASLLMRAETYRLTQQPQEGVSVELDSTQVGTWLQGFRDRSAISEDHSSAVAEAYRLGIISGYDDGRFYPFLTLTRAQAAVMLYAALSQPLLPRTAPPAAVPAESGYPTARVGSRGPLVAWLEDKLTKLSYQPGEIDGVFDGRTSEAVMAFEKVQGLSRNGIATGQVWSAATGASVPAPRLSAAGKRVEIDLMRQVLMLISDGQVVKTLPIASGRNGLETPTGTYWIYSKLPYWRTSTLGQLYKPAYFHNGYAVHGAYSVPPSPASHGCVRVTLTSMDALYPQLAYGMRVDLYY